MTPPTKTFRAAICSILAVLVLIHTTPLYAQQTIMKTAFQVLAALLLPMTTRGPG